MQLERFEVDEPPQGLRLDREVYVLLQQHSILRHHDGLLCQAYHVVYDEWQHLAETRNHWMVAIPQERAPERSDASIVRARREVQSKLHEPSLSLEKQLNAGWDEEGWQEYLAERVDTALVSNYGSQARDKMRSPDQLRDQVAWLLTNHPETRISDKELILQWYQTWGGWKVGKTISEEDTDGPTGYTRYAIPKAHHWQNTTPESITAARRKWHQQGLFLPPESTENRRQDLEGKVRHAFSSGQSPWEVLH